jgi:hypothetical protein
MVQYVAKLTLVGILSMDHVLEPGYATYAVLQVTFTLVSVDLEKLIANVKVLVGEVDFKYVHMSTIHERLANKV